MLIKEQEIYIANVVNYVINKQEIHIANAYGSICCDTQAEEVIGTIDASEVTCKKCLKIIAQWMLLTG